MIENVLRGIGGVGVFGVISICTFFAFFTGMLLWSFLLKKNFLDSMGDLPLDHEIPTRRKLLKPDAHPQTKTLQG